jgi:hypothetical protein
MGSLNSDGSHISQDKKVVRHKGQEIVISTVDNDQEIEAIDAEED